jgi:poly-gamma-glutamate synthesis protein (capsule biosynthesis protein)
MASLTFAAVGDCIISRKSSTRKDPAFLEIVDKIRTADVAFANFEIMVPAEPVIPSSEYGGMHLRAPEYVIDELKWIGFNIFNVANNHSGDFGYKGLVDTMAALRRHDAVFAGGGMNLGEARSPGYLETTAGRVAVLGAASSFTTGSHAAASRPDFGGRPGLSPLRVDREIVLDPPRFAALRDIDVAIGTALVSERRKQFGLMPDLKEGAVKFLGVDFFEGETPAYKQKANEKDVENICRYIADARRQADFVVMTLHAHNGINGDGNNPEMAEFIPVVAHKFIDAGADAFVGHGPHMLRPIEVYNGRPVFYSLGNFIYAWEAIQHYPAEMYEHHKMGPDATPSDVADAWTKDKDGNPKAFVADRRFYESVVPVCRFENKALTEMKLYPVELGRTLPRTERGEPRLVDAQTGREILEGLAEVSSPFGVKIEVQPDGERVVGAVGW